MSFASPFTLMYSNLHITKSRTHHATSNRITAHNTTWEKNESENERKKKRNRKKNKCMYKYKPYSPNIRIVYVGLGKHPKCSYRLFTACSVRALPFQKCTLNLIIQIENNWINQPRNHLEWNIAGGCMQHHHIRSIHCELMNLISVFLSGCVCVSSATCILHSYLSSEHKTHRHTYAKTVNTAYKANSDKMMRQSKKKPHQKTSQVACVARGIWIKYRLNLSPYHFAKSLKHYCSNNDDDGNDDDNENERKEIGFNVSKT